MDTVYGLRDEVQDLKQVSGEHYPSPATDVFFEIVIPITDTVHYIGVLAILYTVSEFSVG